MDGPTIDSAQTSESGDCEEEEFEAEIEEISDVNNVHRLLDAGQFTTSRALRVAVAARAIESIRLLLAINIDANSRPENDKLSNEIIAIKDDWATRSELTPTFHSEPSEWYALQYGNNAVNSWRRATKAQFHTVMTTLLDHGADPFAIYRQPLFEAPPSYFPGETIAQEEEIYIRESKGIYDSEDTFNHVPMPREYGLRCVVHAMLEDGHYSEPILTRPNLDLEHRDPQGRTLILAACRSALGADAAFDADQSDLDWDTAKGRLFNSPFDQARLERTPSLFRFLQQRGANTSAIDARGQNVLHHLFGARECVMNGGEPPRIYDSVGRVLELVPKLVNQPDHRNTYPLHLAFQRIRRYGSETIHRMAPETTPIIDHLLDTGADLLIRDGRGNTLLHYLLNAGICDVFHAEPQRRWLRRFLAAPINVNARNDEGISALEVLLMDANASEWRNIVYPGEGATTPRVEAIDREILGLLDDAGVKWTELSPSNQSLLHIVAKQEVQIGPFLIRYLLQKGVNPNVRNQEGQTALDLARVLLAAARHPEDTEVIDILQEVTEESRE